MRAGPPAERVLTSPVVTRVEGREEIDARRSPLSNVLYGVAPTDPGVLATVALSLFSIALIAASVPAWRASRVDPLVALRHD